MPTVCRTPPHAWDRESASCRNRRARDHARVRGNGSGRARVRVCGGWRVSVHVSSFCPFLPFDFLFESCFLPLTPDTLPLTIVNLTFVFLPFDGVYPERSRRARGRLFTFLWPSLRSCSTARPLLA